MGAVKVINVDVLLSSAHQETDDVTTKEAPETEAQLNSAALGKAPCAAVRTVVASCADEGMEDTFIRLPSCFGTQTLQIMAFQASVMGRKLECFRGRPSRQRHELASACGPCPASDV